MTLLHVVSIALEFTIFILALKMVFERKRYIGVAWAITFGIYVFYDLALGLGWGLPRNFLDTIFFIANLSAFLAILQLGRKRA